MNLIFSDPTNKMLPYWDHAFSRYQDMSSTDQSIVDLSVDAIVSPANSFGFMDGNLDYIITKRLGIVVQERLQKKIKEIHDGELLVGNAEIIPTDFKNIPYVISAPTMRVPLRLESTVNVYLSTRAVFLLVKNGKMDDGSAVSDHVDTVALPGMGTGCGGVHPEIFVNQTKRAYDEVVLGKLSFPTTWQDAQDAHYAMQVTT